MESFPPFFSTGHDETSLGEMFTNFSTLANFQLSRFDRAETFRFARESISKLELLCTTKNWRGEIFETFENFWKYSRLKSLFVVNLSNFANAEVRKLHEKYLESPKLWVDCKRFKLFRWSQFWGNLLGNFGNFRCCWKLSIERDENLFQRKNWNLSNFKRWKSPIDSNDSNISAVGSELRWGKYFETCPISQIFSLGCVKTLAGENVRNLFELLQLLRLSIWAREKFVKKVIYSNKSFETFDHLAQISTVPIWICRDENFENFRPG